MHSITYGTAVPYLTLMMRSWQQSAKRGSYYRIFLYIVYVISSSSLGFGDINIYFFSA